VRALLDVNVLIALFDADHVFHERVHSWWEVNATQGWASCPLTENGVVRIMTAANYSKKVRLAPADLISRLARFVAATDHAFWPDELSLRDSQVFVARRLHSSQRLTDTYLLGLASQNGGRLATLDEGIDLASVSGASSQNLCVIP
jgi:hypothetical protein